MYDKIKLDLKAVQDGWVKEQGPHHVRNIAEHFGLYDHLFASAFFYNTVPMAVCYDYDEAFVTPVCYGNKILPSEAAMAPFVSYESDEDTLWTLVMTSPDGHLQDNDRECLHWMVTNIRGCDVQGGETVCEYLQPFPVRGAGCLRYAFILFQQQKPLDLSDCYPISDSNSLSERTFSTAEFYRKHREDITPASLCFFQSRWDVSVSSVFQNVLKMKEPSYEFIPPPDYHQEERHCPQLDSIEWYLDCYFGEEATLEDWYTEELETHENPSAHPAEESKSPNVASAADPVPSWVKLRLKDLRSHEHQWKDL
ncbi:large ribosomal subunit protein mL38-like [Babylonia areolata]|uniref:large ribosomal subunit protein mL38-like n=1 Tax=Babylonia areolata TaxID=304850 RepID=UPI003FD25EE2